MAAIFHDEVRAEIVETELFDRAAEHRAPRSSRELALQSGFLNMARLMTCKELQETGCNETVRVKIKAQSEDAFPVLYRS